MEIKRGIPVSPGVAISAAVVLDTEDYRIPRRSIPAGRVRSEQARIRKAIHKSAEDVGRLQSSVGHRLGKQTATIFDVHRAFLRDRSFYKKISDTVQDEMCTAEYAVSKVLRKQAKVFLESGDRYMAERVTDIYDIERRILKHLLGQATEELTHLTDDVAIVAHDLTPSLTASLGERRIHGIATDVGGRTSHSAIVARALGIPAVVGLNDISADVSAGDVVIIDGNRGVVIINPDEKTLEAHRLYQAELTQFEHQLEELRALPAETRDGVRIQLMGNIEFPHEAAECIERGADGIGLYRTEYLYLGAEEEPTEEEHFKAYQQASEDIKDLPIYIRTLDLGADKYTQARRGAPEPNPFLGCRSIRFCLRHLDLFRVQLRALLRVSVKDNVSIILPLVTTLLELRQARMIIRDVMEELEEEGIEHARKVPLGIMVETPSAAMTVKSFAREVDFFSIGTNDLIQYTLAVDRGNEAVAGLFSAAHPAILQMIRYVLRIGRRTEVPVSLCGEMAGDPIFTHLLLGLGLTQFSVSPTALLEVKKMIRSTTLDHARKVSRRCLSFDSDRQITNYLREETKKIIPEAF